jgi:hypothetical protein
MPPALGGIVVGPRSTEMHEAATTRTKVWRVDRSTERARAGARDIVLIVLRRLLTFCVALMATW